MNIFNGNIKINRVNIPELIDVENTIDKYNSDIKDKDEYAKVLIEILRISSIFDKYNISRESFIIKPIEVTNTWFTVIYDNRNVYFKNISIWDTSVNEKRSYKLDEAYHSSWIKGLKFLMPSYGARNSGHSLYSSPRIYVTEYPQIPSSWPLLMKDSEIGVNGLTSIYNKTKDLDIVMKYLAKWIAKCSVVTLYKMTDIGNLKLYSDPESNGLAYYIKGNNPIKVSRVDINDDKITLNKLKSKHQIIADWCKLLGSKLTSLIEMYTKRYKSRCK